MSLRYAPRGGLLLPGHQTGRGGRRGATGLLRARGLCHFFVRSRVACVVPPLLWCVLRVPVIWLPGRGSPWRMGLVGRVAGACVRGLCCHALLAGGALRGSFPHPLFGSLVGCGSPWQSGEIW